MRPHYPSGYFLVYLLSFAFPVILFSQSAAPNEIPAFLQKLSAATNPAEQANLCNELAYAYGKINLDSALYFTAQAFAFGEKAKDVKQTALAMNLAGDTYLRMGDFASADSIYRSALKFAEGKNEKEMEGRALHNLGKMAHYQTDFEVATTFYQKAIGIREDIDDKKGLSSSKYNLAVLYSGLGDLEKSNGLLTEAAALKAEVGDREGENRIKLMLSQNLMQISEYDQAESLLLEVLANNLKAKDKYNAHLAYAGLGKIKDTQGKHHEALAYFEKSLELAHEVGDVKSIAGQLNNVAAGRLILNDYPQALEELVEAEQMAEQIGDEILQSQIFHNLGLLKGYLGEHREAITFLERALALNKQPAIKANNADLISTAHQNLGESGKQMEWAERSMEYALQTEDRWDDTQSHICMAEAFQSKGKNREALDHIRQCIGISKEIGTNKFLSQAYRIESKILASLGQLDEATALEKAHASLAAAEANGSLEQQSKAHQHLSETFQEMGNADSAVHHLRLAEAAEDSIFNLNKMREITTTDMNRKFSFERDSLETAAAEMETQSVAQRKRLTTLALILGGLLLLGGIGFFAFRKNQRQKTALRESESRRQVAEAELKLLLDRQRIGRDLHDEVGSTLSSISILSETALRNLEGDLEKGRGQFAKVGERSREALESISDIVWSINPENDSMEAVTARMRQFAAETLEAANIDLKFKTGEGVENLPLATTARKDLYLIFKEAINNAAKYLPIQKIK